MTSSDQQCRHPKSTITTFLVLALFLQHISLVSSRESRPENLPSSSSMLADDDEYNVAQTLIGNSNDNDDSLSFLPHGKSSKFFNGSKSGKKSSQTLDSRDEGQIILAASSKSSKNWLSKSTKRRKSQKNYAAASKSRRSADPLLSQLKQTRIATSPSMKPLSVEEAYRIFITRKKVLIPTLLREDGSSPSSSSSASSSSSSSSLSIQQSNTRKACILVELGVNFGGQPENLHWIITLGNRDTLENGDAIIVAESQFGYVLDQERLAICLPGNALYTFSIFNWEGNGSGGYELLASDGRVILEGGEFGWIQTHTFTLPLPELPSDRPSRSLQPSISPAPSMDCTFVDIEITFDSYPEQTSWLVFEGDYDNLVSGDVNIIAKSPAYEPSSQFAFATETYRVCLPIDDDGGDDGSGSGKKYSFGIFDWAGNGLCCVAGQGGYIVSSPDYPNENGIIAQGGEFGSNDVTTFHVPFGSVPITDPPMSAPPSSPVPTIDCYTIEVSFLFDSFPSETKYSITDGDSNIVFLSESYDDWEYAGVFKQEILCLPEGDYVFQVFDVDGICCLYGEGGYSVVYTDGGSNDLIAEGTTFQNVDITAFTLPFVPKSPTLSPAPTTSLAPSKRCFLAEVAIEFGMTPSDLIWVIVEGDADGINNDDWVPEVAAEAPSYNRFPPYSSDTQSVCLEEKQYTFFIVNEGSAEGSYSLVLVQEDGSKTIVAQGAAPQNLESVTFSIPYDGPSIEPGDDRETPSPSPATGMPTPLITNQPTETPPPTADCLWMQITLEFAVFPYSMRWYLFAGDFDTLEQNKQELIAESPDYTGVPRYETVSHDICLPNEDGIYSFVILDESPVYGSGIDKYILSQGLDKETFAFGGDFNYFELVTFEVPFMPVPTSTPSVSLQPSPPNAPPSDCRILLEVVMKTDAFPEETRWEVAAGEVAVGESSTEPQALLVAQSPITGVSDETYDICLPWPGAYTFTIFDSAGDGICCTGNYELVLNGISIFSSDGRFKYVESTTFSYPYVPPPNPPTATPTVSQQPTISAMPTVELGCVEVVTFIDESDRGVSWDIASGSESSYTSNAVVVATSPYYPGTNASSTEVELVCLEDGIYTFTIVGGGYSLIFKDDSNPIIAEGSDVDFYESVTFTIPYVAPPTTSPTVSHQPTLSQNPTNACINVDLGLTFDSFPDETSWAVLFGEFDPLASDDGYIDNNLVVESPDYDPENYTDVTESVSICLPGEGVYSFVIADSSYDGMCCSFGNGGYVLSSQGSVIAQGGRFQEYEITTFSIPFVPAPSMSPSVSTPPTSSTSPTDDCNIVEISILFDAYPAEISWLVTEGESDATVAESPVYDSNSFGTTISEKLCLEDGTFTFVIVDGAGDGMCCGNFGDGKYTLTFIGDEDPVVIVEGGEFGYYESTTFLLPYLPFPTSAPSVSPQPTSSISPSAPCIWIEVILNFDGNSYDTLWDIAIGSSSSFDVDDAISVASSPLYSFEDAFSTKRQAVCLPGKGRYTFGIMKTGGFQGNGGYMIVELFDSNRELLVQGGEFDWTDSVTFDVPVFVSPRV